MFPIFPRCYLSSEDPSFGFTFNSEGLHSWPLYNLPLFDEDMIPDSPASFSSFSDDSSDFIVADINSSSDEEYEASPNASAFSTYSPGGQEDEDEDEESSLTSCCDDDQDSERSPPPLPSLPCCASRNPSKEASAATIEEFRGLPTLEMIDWLETKQLLGVRVKAHMQRNRYTGLSIDTFHMGETLPAGMTPGMRHELEELSRFVHEHFNAYPSLKCPHPRCCEKKKRFYHITDTLEHVWSTHLSHREFQCDRADCTKRFSTGKKLNRHTKEVHGSSKKKKKASSSSSGSK